MTNLDALLAGGQALIANHTAVDHLINGALYYGPGLFLAALAVCSWRAYRRITDRIQQHRDDQADRRHYAATAARLHRVADVTDAVMAMPPELLIAQLDAKYDATPDHATEGEK